MQNRVLIPVFFLSLVGALTHAAGAADDLFVKYDNLSHDIQDAPSNLTFSNITSSTLNVSFTNSSSPDGYLVLRSEGTAVTDDPEDGTTYSVGNTINAGTVVYIGEALGFSETGLTPSTTYHYAIYAYNGSGGGINYLTSSSLEGSAATLAEAPVTQPANLTISNPTSTTCTVNFESAPDNPDGYLVLRRVGTAVTIIPVDGTTYSEGNTLGLSTVVHVGNALSFNETVLTESTTYYYAVFSYNGSGESTNYLTSSPLAGSMTTSAEAPAGQPSNLTFFNLTSSGFTGNFVAASGNPDGYLILRREGAAVTDVPVDGTTYPPGSTLNASAVVYAGSAVSFNETGLAPSTTYHYAIFSYNGSAEGTNYLTSSPLTGGVATIAEPPVAQPSNLTFSDLTSSSLTGNFVAASDNPQGYLVLRRAGTAVTDVPVDGTTYPAGSTINVSTVVYAGSALSFNETGLAPSTTYHYTVFSYNGSAESSNYLTSSPLSGSSVTMADAPTAQPSNLTFSDITSASFTGNFTAASGNPGGYLVLRTEGAPVTDAPMDGITYLPGNTVNAGTVVYVGSALSFDETGLTSATAYHYAVFAYNGSGGATNYLTSAPLVSSAATLAEANVGQPSNLTFSNLTPTSFTGNFTDADPVPTGYLVLMCRNVPPDIDPVDGVPYTQNQILGTTSGNNVYVVSIGSGTSFAIASLTPGAQLFFKVYSYNGTGSSINYLTSLPLSGSQRALHNEPTIQASAINFIAATSTSLSFNFTNGNGTSRMVVVRAGSPVDSDPADGTGYTANSTFGSGSQIGIGNFIVGSGSGLFTVTGLDFETVYHFRVYEFNGSDGSENYNVSSATGNPSSRSSIKAWHVSTTGTDSNDGSSAAPLRNIQTALAQALGGEAIKVSTGTYIEELITPTKVTLLGGYAPDFIDSNRDIYLNRTTVRAFGKTILKDANGSTIDGFFFDGNNTAETGLNISSSSVVTHNVIVRCTESPGRGISLSGGALVANNTIHNNITGTRISGGTSAGAKFKNNIVTGNTVGLSNSAANGIHRYNDIQGNTSDYAGSFDNPGTGDISLNPVYLNSASDDFRLQGTSPAIDGGDPSDPVGDEPLPNGGRIDIGAYGGTKNATSADPFMAEPTAQASALSFSTIATSSFVLNFTSGNGGSRLVVARSSSAVDSDPVDGTTYTANSAFGSGHEIGTANYVVGLGSGPITVTGLAPGTVYHFRVYEFNGSGGAENYLVATAIGNPASQSPLDPLPIITNFNPTSGAIGLSITIIGTNFHPIPTNNTIRFNNTQAVVTASNATSITTSVPAGATTGKITVTVAGQTATSVSDFTVSSSTAPTLSGFNPTSGPVDTPVTLTGTNFDLTPANNTVEFNNIAAVVTASDATSITTSVPVGATTGKITITVGGQTATSANDFTVSSASAPTLTGLNPTSGPVGTIVTLTGTNFNSNAANNTVKFFNNILAGVTGSNATSITTAVPLGAATGPVKVTVGGQAATSSINFTVTVGNPPVVADNTPTSIALGNPVTISTQITAESTITAATVEYRSVSAGGSAIAKPLNANGSTYTAQILTAEIGELGFEYKVSASSAGGTTSGIWKTVKVDRVIGLIIPYSSFGKGQANYSIVAVPLELRSNTVANVFDELGAYNKTRWRMYRFRNGQTTELSPGEQILPGLGYWLIIKDDPGMDINSGAGTTVQANTDAPFEIDLAAGWNQIGNPYDFNLSWADVQAANPGLPGLRKFNGDFIDGTRLDKMEGGFVKVTTAQKLKFPVVKNSSANGGRSKEETELSHNSLDQPNWQVNLTLQQGNSFNRISGFGMNEKASDGFDVYDGFNLPRFFDTFLNVNHHKKEGADFCSSDVVPTTENHTWEFSVESSSEERRMTLMWDNTYFGDNDIGLVLWDIERQLGTDMRTASHYDFDKSVSGSFKVFFGSKQEIQEKTEVSGLLIHSISPNPSAGDITICFSTPQGGKVSMEAIDLLGRKVWSSENEFSKGYHEVVWGYETRAGFKGIHIIRVQDGSAAIQERIYLK